LYARAFPVDPRKLESPANVARIGRFDFATYLVGIVKDATPPAFV
jgi:hypothetical protein